MKKRKNNSLFSEVSQTINTGKSNINSISENRLSGFQSVAFKRIPEIIAGMNLKDLRDDYRDRIFRQYLPFWEKGGYDSESGGFMCELNSDGAVVNDEKYIWYQGRGIWVYSFLYNNFGRDKRFLEIAVKSYEFLIKNMYIGDGKWHESVNRTGKPVASTVAQGSEKDVYGALFAAAGLIEFYRATGNEEIIKLAKTSIRSSVMAYEDLDYEGIKIDGIESKGLRSQGHSFMIVWILNNLLSFHEDQSLEELIDEHVNHLMTHFWNADYGIVNEILFHDYSRVPGYDQVMFAGHSLEALWMVLAESLRRNDKQLFKTCKQRIRRIIEMNWDYVFDGWCTQHYHVFNSELKCQGPDYDLKVMWAHCELLVATMMVLELTGEIWAIEWYERARDYCIRKMANTGCGIWREAVDRFGRDKKRPGISIYRKDNFHQIRYQMMNLLSIERIIKNKFYIKPL